LDTQPKTVVIESLQTLVAKTTIDKDYYYTDPKEHSKHINHQMDKIVAKSIADFVKCFPGEEIVIKVDSMKRQEIAEKYLPDHIDYSQKISIGVLKASGKNDVL
jgi:hypothetical protein